ncbi:class I SAM-dependent methyltransferase [Ahrensia sp. R2A130]|uniref:class I SAM-dependent methyltransferase n=1 Tax=Ahrensia sp. R2A130 TaxID=744979 RepID=UPI0001E0D821|nr:class I SAM-dependent methyltransferase [Ahrensia sp. R2A130]EFL89778.1 methyltransferase type 11 [Ahrensia sp. R2A130]
MSKAAENRHFEAGGDNYAKHRPTYPIAIAQALAALCARTDNALDVGCGTGQLSVLLASQFTQVTATDPSEAQIANATAHPNVTYRTEPAEQMRSADGSVDLVVAAQAAHWFDIDRFYKEARRVARPGGVLVLVSYGVPQLDNINDTLCNRFKRFYWQDVHHHWPPGREHVEQGYRSLPFPFDEQALPPLTIERQWSFAELEGYIRTWSASKRAIAAGETAVLEVGLTHLKSLWGDPATQQNISWPIVGRVAILG